MITIFTIEDNICGGKSTLIRLLEKKYPEILCILEPVKDWEKIKDKGGENILTKFYKNQKKYSFSFQMMAYISRLASIKKVIKNNKYRIIITERSVYTDKEVFAKMLYNDDKIEEVNYQIYLQWFDEFIKDIPLDGIIYLRTSPEKCLERIIKRGREGEIISLEYLEKCHNYHEEWLKDKKQILILNGNLEFKNNSDQILYNIYKYTQDVDRGMILKNDINHFL